MNLVIINSMRHSLSLQSKQREEAIMLLDSSEARKADFLRIYSLNEYQEMIKGQKDLIKTMSDQIDASVLSAIQTDPSKADYFKEFLVHTDIRSSDNEICQVH